MRNLFTFLLFLLMGNLMGAESIGAIIAIEGTARARDELSKERALQLNSTIYIGDTILVALESRLQIRFTDGGLLNLLPETEYKIDAYQYKKLARKDHYGAELLKGGFRSLSGSIAKKNPSEYQVKTPTSTLGLRGTVVEVRIIEDVVYFGVSSGVAIITNSAGSRLIGTGERSQYAVVYSDHDIPEYLNEKPDYLDQRIFNEPIGGLSMERIQQIQTSRPPAGPVQSAPQAAPQGQPPQSRAPAASSPGGVPTPLTPQGAPPPQDTPTTPTGPSIQGLEERQGGSFKEGTQALPGGGSGGGGASVGGGC